jgi:hypothetical protein
LRNELRRSAADPVICLAGAGSPGGKVTLGHSSVSVTNVAEPRVESTVSPAVRFVGSGIIIVHAPTPEQPVHARYDEVSGG